VALGYWGDAKSDPPAFGAKTADGDGPFLRTGDLGFRWKGELYVTGRIKDLIIAGGRNVYPQDVEATVERAHPAIRSGCAAAFSVETAEGEDVVCVCEIDASRAEDLDGRQIAADVSREHRVSVGAVALIAPRTLPRTTSGKVQRRALRSAFTSARLDALAEWRLARLASSRWGGPREGAP
jgi:acyl-CoA synthetase (AMP-forming)/AMP-acid ligase II